MTIVSAIENAGCVAARIGSALVVAAILVTGCGANQPPAGQASSTLAPGTTAVSELPETLDAAQFAELVATEGVVVLDVRTPAEFASGHLTDAININVEAADFADQIAELDQQATYAVYCRSGNRSQTALNMMRDAGFEQLHHLGGGIGAWQRAGYPVVQ